MRPLADFAHTDLLRTVPPKALEDNETLHVLEGLHGEDGGHWSGRHSLAY
jgi:hypothetical protein